MLYTTNSHRLHALLLVRGTSSALRLPFHGLLSERVKLSESGSRGRTMGCFMIYLLGSLGDQGSKTSCTSL
eukprot:4010180-Amphidinium_carterae.1